MNEQTLSLLHKIGVGGGGGGIKAGVRCKDSHFECLSPLFFLHCVFFAFYFNCISSGFEALRCMNLTPNLQFCTGRQEVVT